MLTENDVIEKLGAYLESKGYKIEQSLGTTEKGIDLIATHAKQTMYVEAKGETSASKTSSRYGKPFTHSQVRTHVAVAILTAMQTLNSVPSGGASIVAISLPDNAHHVEFINSISGVLNKLSIRVYLVGPGGVRIH